MGKRKWFPPDVKPNDEQRVLIYRKGIGDNLGYYEAKDDIVRLSSGMHCDSYRNKVKMASITKWKPFP